MTPRIPGYHFRPLVQPTIHNPLPSHFTPKIDMPSIPDYYSYDRLQGYADAWKPKPTHPDYPFLPNYIPPKDNFNW